MSPDPARPAALGVVGGGQLGRMLGVAARTLGLGCVVLEPGADPPAGAVADVVVGAYDDDTALAELAGRVDVVTVELEEVDVAALGRVVEGGRAVRPSPASVRVCQDRLLEKRLVGEAGLATARWAEVHGPDDLAAVGFPAVAKLRRGGFDGRGQVSLGSADDVAQAWAWVAGRPALVESRVAFTREVSALVARGVGGEVRSWPVVENLHVDGQLAWSRAGVEAPGAVEAAAALAERLDHVGVLTVEMFDTPDGLLVNELAPRVHNSGHWTIEGAETSQFAQHVRAVCGWPLGSTEPRGQAAMANLLGTVPAMDDLLSVPGASVHLYGKAERPGRKLGHVTVVASSTRQLADRCRRLVGVVDPDGAWPRPTWLDRD